MEDTPVLNQVRRVSNTGGRYWFKCLFDHQPTDREVWEAQDNAGYSPYGYGQPMGISHWANGDGTYETSWCCFDNCD